MPLIWYNRSLSVPHSHPAGRNVTASQPLQASRRRKEEEETVSRGHALTGLQGRLVEVSRHCTVFRLVGRLLPHAAACHTADLLRDVAASALCRACSFCWQPYRHACLPCCALTSAHRVCVVEERVRSSGAGSEKVANRVALLLLNAKRALGAGILLDSVCKL